MATPEVQYKIVALDRAAGQITVKFRTADVSEGVKVNIDIPVQGGAYLDLRGQALTDYIMGFCPVAHFERIAERMVALAVEADLSYIESLVEPEVEEPVRTSPVLVDL